MASNRGGKREGAGRPRKGEVTVMPADGVFAGEVIQDYESAKSFLLDIVNLRFDRLGVGKISMSERITAARELMPYTDQQKPKLVTATHNHSWAETVRRAESRLNATPEQTATETAAAETVTDAPADDTHPST